MFGYRSAERPEGPQENGHSRLLIRVAHSPLTAELGISARVRHVGVRRRPPSLTLRRTGAKPTPSNQKTRSSKEEGRWVRLPRTRRRTRRRARKRTRGPTTPRPSAGERRSTQEMPNIANG